MNELQNMFIGPGANTCLEHWKALPCEVCTDHMNRAVAKLTKVWEAMHMSWSASVSSVMEVDVPEKLRQNFAVMVPEPTTEVKEQFEAALQALAILLPTTLPALGTSPAHRVTVSLAGHANPGHEKAGGWSNDAITVSIVQV